MGRGYHGRGGPGRGGHGRGWRGRGGGSGHGAMSEGDRVWNAEPQDGEREFANRGGGGEKRGRYHDPDGLYPSESNSAAPAPPARRTDSHAEPAAVLRDFFQRAEGGPYPRLNELRNRTFSLDDSARISMTFNSIQPDPFAPGSQVVVKAPRGLPLAVTGSAKAKDLKHGRKVAAEDFYLRSMCEVIGRDRAIEVQEPSQHVLQRNAVLLSDTEVELRLRVKIPGHGRRIDGRGCTKIFYGTVLSAFQSGVIHANEKALSLHCDSVEDQQWLRDQLRPNGIVAFVANESVLPRGKGNSDAPMAIAKGAVPFASPDSLERTFTLPCSGRTVTGMGLPHGITLIAGGGFHGKSTLLRALEVGVYDHIPGDGREFVVTDPTAVKIRAEDRRSIVDVDISPFINQIPNGKDTAQFTSPDASGSTSQAANIAEAVEAGSTALLIDEDTSATNFMIRDALMKQLVAPDREPITPFTDRVRHLYDSRGVSTIIVVGGSGQFFSVADTVLVMDSYVPHEVTNKAKEIAANARNTSGEVESKPSPVASDWLEGSVRHVTDTTFKQALNVDRPKASATALDTISFGKESIDLSGVEQLVERGQTNAIAMSLCYMADITAGRGSGKGSSEVGNNTVLELAAVANTAMLQTDMNVASRVYYAPLGFCALPRPVEIAAALNRLRSLAIRRAVLK